MRTHLCNLTRLVAGRCLVLQPPRLLLPALVPLRTPPHLLALALLALLGLLLLLARARLLLTLGPHALLHLVPPLQVSLFKQLGVFAHCLLQLAQLLANDVGIERHLELLELLLLDRFV